MEQVIQAIQSAAGELPVKPYGTDINEECVCYAFSPISDDGAVAVRRLELRIITRTIAKTEEVRPKILSTLVTVADNPKHGYLRCYLNGGGSLWDDNTKMTHTILYLYITTKSEVSYNG